jgi:pyridinium-3,5-bisthiocarboxylic acid mononucleotide nickel chelatase
MSYLAYWDCPTGLAGDMCLGALVDAGVPLEYLQGQLAKLGLGEELRIEAELVLRNGQQATKVRVLSAMGEEGPAVAVARAETHHPHAHHPHPHDPHHSHDPHTHHSHPHDPHTHNPSSHASHAPTRHLPEIVSRICRAQLPARVEAWSIAVFEKLAQAEGAVHGISPQQVHFHEVGAADAIADIVGTCLGLDWLGVDQIYCSALPVGGGMIRAAHGQLPVPAPATLKLFELGQVPVYHNGINRELVTPTGAALAIALATAFGPPPAMRLQKVGLGAGGLELPLPNLVRLWLGTAEGPAPTTRAQANSHTHDHSHDHSHNHPHPHAQAHGHSLEPGPTPTKDRTDPDRRSPQLKLDALDTPALETVLVLETQIDDLSPQAIAYCLEQLLAAGALDAFTQSVGMKKSRAGLLITAIAPLEGADHLEAILFRETSTLGIRRQVQQRRALPRRFTQVQTDYGPVPVKLAYLGGECVNAQPEYEDCATLARQHHVPWRRVHQAAIAGLDRGR